MMNYRENVQSDTLAILIGSVLLGIQFGWMAGLGAFFICNGIRPRVFAEGEIKR
jgi:hypothetical protein